MDEIIAKSSMALKEGFGLAPTDIVPQTGGWSASAFRVVTAAGRYFLKVYDKQRSSTSRLIAPTCFYLPVAKWLHDHTLLQGRIVNPVAATDGRFVCEDDAYYYLLFDYIDGVTVGDNELSAGRMSELGEIVGLLHSATDEVPLPAGGVSEDYSLPFCDGLEAYLDCVAGNAPEDLHSILQPNSAAVLKMIGRVRRLAETAKAETHNYVLCHTDIHKWNLMAGDRLVLVDLENLKLAPPEHDLYMLLPEPHAQDFMRAYRRYMPAHRTSESLLEFYTVRRELEDVWEWIKQLLYDRPDAGTRAGVMHWLRWNLHNLGRMAAAR